MGPVIGQQREGDAAQLLRPCFQAWNRIGADLQDFDVLLLEFFEVRTEPGDLILSSTGEGEGQEADYDGAATETGQGYFLIVVVRGQTEIGRCGSCFELCHADTPLGDD